MASIESVVLNQLAYTRVDDVLILCSGRLEASEQEFASWLERLRVEDYKFLLVSSRGNAGLSAKQRSRVAEFWKVAGRKPPRAALLSDSAVARGVMIAISWLIEGAIKAFSPQDVSGALAFLGTSVPPVVIAHQLDVLHAALEAKARRSA